MANTQPEEAALPVDPCRVVVTFRYGTGQLVRNRKGEIIRRVVDLEAGKTAILDLNFDADLPADVPSRVQIRAAVNVILPAVQNNTLPVDPCIPNIEVINNATGRTQFGMFSNPGVIRGINPQPDPPAGE